MKKVLLSIFAVSIMGSAIAWDITFVNKSPQELQSEVIYAGPGVCSKDRVNIHPKSSKKIGTGLCCPTHIWVRKMTGKNPGKWHLFEPRRTGAGISCTNNKLIIHENPDSSLTMERG